jgi:hypothetical protein
MAGSMDMKKDDTTIAPPINFVHDDDDKELVALGYVPSFKREFSNLATVSSAQ